MIKILLPLLPLLSIVTTVIEAADIERLINVRDMYPNPSPDGSSLVFESNRVGAGQVFVMNMDGSQVTQLTDFEFGAETPVFSPDGRQIAFAAYTEPGNNDVFVMNADGSGLTQLTRSPGYDGHPHWSADGARIVFNSDRTTPGLDADLEMSWSDRWHEIFSMSADGGDVQQHSRCRAVCTYGSLSPDGSKLLYRKTISGPGLNWSLGLSERNSEVFISDLNGDNEINLSLNAAFDGWPVWSPDGSQIAFASNRSGPALTGSIWLISADGSGLRRLSQGPWSYAQPAWSSSGEYIYAYQNQETESHEFGSIVRIAVANNTRLTN